MYVICYSAGNNINNIETLNFIKCFNLAYLDISNGIIINFRLKFNKSNKMHE
jgi:hypothetical protein